MSVEKGTRGSKSDWPAWLAFTAAILTLASNVVINYLDHRATAHSALLEHRRAALEKALHAIDYVYANSEFHIAGKQSAPATRPWDIQIARDAMNEMLVYCADPKNTVSSFEHAIGLHSPDEPAPTFTAASINDFRLQVAKELEVPTPRWFDDQRAWIRDLPGTDSRQLPTPPSSSPPN